MKLLSTEQTLWDKEIDIRLTLRELQELYCALGITSYGDREDEWRELSFETCPFNNNEHNHFLYGDLGQILREQGGITHNG